MIINVINSQNDLKISKPQVKKIAAEVIKLENKIYDEVTIHFVGTRRICKLHEQFFDDPSQTDCISFPMDGGNQVGYKILGEIFVCPQTAIEYARSHDQNPYQETTLYVVHGLLHLLGYDDIEPKERSKMRRAEKKQMDHLQELDLMLCNPIPKEAV